jgi:DNA-binding response OmpR family regulator
MVEKSDNQSTVLIVDDTPDNLGVLSEWLEESGIETMTALSGERALELVKHAKPDLILLDVLMPYMDGFETCLQLKENPNTRNIPVIFITALMDTTSKIKGFSTGAVDYVAKPVQREEVLARVHTHLTISRLQKQLSEQNIELQRRNATLNEFTRAAAHDLFPPLKVVIEAAKTLRMEFDNMDENQIIRQINKIDESSNQMVGVILETLLNDKLLS